MSLVQEERHETLRLGGVGGPAVLASGAEIRRKPGVIVFEDIPVGLKVFARVDRLGPQVRGVITPDLGEDGGRGVGDLAAGTIQGYRFERAPGPATVTLPGGATRRTRQQFRVPAQSAPFGPFDIFAEVPVFVAFAPVQDGSLVQSGRDEHLLPLTGGAIPKLDRDLVRFRWTGTVVAAATLVALSGDLTAEADGWVNDDQDLVPGSIVATLPGPAGTLRDNGRGELVGSDGTGFGLVDYQTGAFKFKFYQAQTGNLLVDYEHECPYEPLDVHLAWDSLLQ